MSPRSEAGRTGAAGGAGWMLVACGVFQIALFLFRKKVLLLLGELPPPVERLAGITFAVSLVSGVWALWLGVDSLRSGDGADVPG